MVKHSKGWLVLFVLACVGVVGFFYYAYLFKPPELVLPKFSWFEIGLVFLLGFFPSVISRWVANILSGQVEADAEGFVSTIKDMVYGWVVYYFLLLFSFILWDYLIYNTLPELW